MGLRTAGRGLFLVVFVGGLLQISLLFNPPGWVLAQNPAVSGKLEPGKGVVRQIKEGETHSFPLILKAHTFLELDLEQKGVDVLLRFIGPDGKTVAEVNRMGGKQGPETLLCLAVQAGNYQVEITPVVKTGPAASYELTLTTERPATKSDQALVEIDQQNRAVEKLIEGGKYDEALELAQQTGSRAESAFGAEGLPLARSTYNLGVAFWFKGRNREAEPLLRRALDLREKHLGPEHPETAESLNALGAFYRTRREFAKAEPLLQRALAVREKTLGPEHPDTADTISYLSTLYTNQGNSAKAEPLLLKALAIREQELGPEHPEVAISLSNLASLYRSRGDYAKAKPLYLRALAIREKALGPDHPEVATSLNQLFLLYRAKGDFERAEPPLLRALAIREKALGPDHTETGASVTNLAAHYLAKGEYAKSEAAFQRAEAIQLKALGPEHPTVGQLFNNHAMLWRERGDLAKAEELAVKSLAIREKTLGSKSPETAFGYANLALLYEEKGDFARAEPLFLKSLAIREELLGPNHPDVGQSLNNLAYLYKEKGDYTRAEPLYLRAVAIQEKQVGPDHPDLAAALNNLGVLYDESGDWVKSATYYQRALAIIEKKLGPEHPSVAMMSGNLGAFYRDRGDYGKAEPILRRSLASLEKSVGPEHPDYATVLNNLALLHQKQGQLDRAEPLFKQALGVWEKSLGPEYPYLAHSLGQLAKLNWTKGETDQAVRLLTECNELIERDTVRNLVTGSERQKALFLRKTAEYSDATISLQTQLPANQEALKAAMTVILRRKGRALDAMTNSVAALRDQSDEETKKLLLEYANLAGQISALALKGPGKQSVAAHVAHLRSLEEQKEKLENEISTRSREFQAQSTPITLEAVQKQIPANGVLLEFAVFKPFDAKTLQSGPARYAVYLLNRQGELKAADLGPAAPIDQAVLALRAALGDQVKSAPKTVKRLAQTLDRLVLRPVRPLLGKANHLLISPDGTLNLIPFAALVDEKGRYLVENHTLTNLTSGRDLLRLQVKVPHHQPAFVLANPDYSAGNGPVLAGKSFRPLLALPETAREGTDIQRLLPQATLAMQTEATEMAVKSVRGPEILHIATHGFFLDQAPAPPPNGTGGQRILERQDDANPDQETLRQANPLLRSWLFFSGANQGGNQENDGTMTALEAAQLNLWGTKLVVLSACDTGLGEIHNGDGVFGLRRALVLAGSETQLMSLWSVSDEATRELMVAYYQNLKAGLGRSEALRQVQLRMLKNPKRAAPYFWAAFIQSGEWANLAGQR